MLMRILPIVIAIVFFLSTGKGRLVNQNIWHRLEFTLISFPKPIPIQGRKVIKELRQSTYILVWSKDNWLEKVS